MAKIEKTPAEWAKWIDEMYTSAPNPAAIPPLVEDLLVAFRDAGHDQGVEALAAYLDGLADECFDPAPIAAPKMEELLRELAAYARQQKKGGA